MILEDITEMSNAKEIFERIKASEQPAILIGSRNTDWPKLVEGFLSQSELEPGGASVFDPESGIKELRRIISSLSVKPGVRQIKLLFIVEAEKLNHEEANSLLKILEEPPSYCRIILATSSISRILPTIKSRCLKFAINSEDKNSHKQADLLVLLREADFGSYFREIKNIETQDFPAMLEQALNRLKAEGLEKGKMTLYKKLSQDLIKISSCNVNRKLVLEEIFIWYKAQV